MELASSKYLIINKWEKAFIIGFHWQYHVVHTSNACDVVPCSQHASLYIYSYISYLIHIITYHIAVDKAIPYHIVSHDTPSPACFRAAAFQAAARPSDRRSGLNTKCTSPPLA